MRAPEKGTGEDRKRISQQQETTRQRAISREGSAKSSRRASPPGGRARGAARQDKQQAERIRLFVRFLLATGYWQPVTVLWIGTHAASPPSSRTRWLKTG